MARSWHPRGEVTWPEWRSAVPGVARVEHVRSGRQGTFARWPAATHPNGNPIHAIVTWDDAGFGLSRGAVCGLRF